MGNLLSNNKKKYKDVINMYVQFLKPKSNLDLLYTVPVNTIGNILALTGATLGLTSVSAIALKILGYNGASIAFNKACSNAVGAVGAGVVGAGMFASFAALAVAIAIKRRQKRVDFLDELEGQIQSRLCKNSPLTKKFE